MRELTLARIATIQDCQFDRPTYGKAFQQSVSSPKTSDSGSGPKRNVGCLQQGRHSMIGCDRKPGCPPVRPVRGDRRSCNPGWQPPTGPAEAPIGCRDGLPNGDAGATGRAQQASLVAGLLRAAGPPVPVSATSAGLAQATQGRRARRRNL
jgi:hypothetical protein